MKMFTPTYPPPSRGRDSGINLNKPMERGIVVEIRGDTILVETGTASLCAGCSASHTCAMSPDRLSRRLWMDNDGGARVGDGVTFEIAERAVVTAAAVVYLLPVLMLIAGTVLGASAGGRFGLGGDLPSIAGGIAGLLVSFPASWALSAVMKKKKVAVPHLLDITRREGGINCG
ncbi:MAG TPA: SoxR reducing system RseC family protein [Spirochaetota bacterium]|nr:SoxR reducing system RseC family protein [Spirochaetota bacterium]HQF09985.1 SoxR reducing system RseC family protein [Spirochaetota bacterium]HQH98689.1 SoxR reducing system RseC family protein [Spirochaetota bacterium]HQJ72405.1 SoxR reducing system RseC family protein [Spirochaetota bacterium]HRS78774.1 SoxR reducing system RseC family protein [Spirochaetota bacterium]